MTVRKSCYKILVNCCLQTDDDDDDDDGSGGGDGDDGGDDDDDDDDDGCFTSSYDSIETPNPFDSKEVMLLDTCKLLFAN